MDNTTAIHSCNATSKEEAEKMYVSQTIDGIESGADRDRRTLLNHEESPFLRLPIDLRYEVYKYVLSDLVLLFCLDSRVSIRQT